MNIWVNELSQFQNYICHRKMSHKKRNGQVRLGDKWVCRNWNKLWFHVHVMVEGSFDAQFFSIIWIHHLIKLVNLIACLPMMQDIAREFFKWRTTQSSKCIQSFSIVSALLTKVNMAIGLLGLCLEFAFYSNWMIFDHATLVVLILDDTTFYIDHYEHWKLRHSKIWCLLYNLLSNL